MINTCLFIYQLFPLYRTEGFSEVIGMLIVFHIQHTSKATRKKVTTSCIHNHITIISTIENVKSEAISLILI